MSDIPRNHKADDFDAAFEEWRKALRLADDFSQGRIYIAFYGALAILDEQTKRLLNDFQPDAQMGRAYVLPTLPDEEDE